MLERYHPTTCTISDLIVGNSYSFRVFSENLCGLSASAAVTKELAHIQKAGGSGPGPAMLVLPLSSLPFPVGFSQVLPCPHPRTDIHTRAHMHTQPHTAMNIPTYWNNRKDTDVGTDFTSTSEQTHSNKKPRVGGCGF